MLRILILLLAAPFAITATAKHAESFLNGKDPAQVHAVLVSAVAFYPRAFTLHYAADAEVARTYHWLIDHGVPAQNIILFMNGRFANNTKYNPFPGTLFSDLNMSRNYAKDLQIDYSGNEVNVANYMAVLRGEADKVKGGSGRVLNSTSKNRVFISHEGHGDSGLLVVNNEFFTVKELHETLNHMEEKRMFQELAYYVMACLSGSMFNGNLTSKEKIYALTAADPKHFAVSRDLLQVHVHGKDFEVYVNTEFGKAWLNDAEHHNTQRETLNEQFIDVYPLVVSHASRYGDLKIGKEPVANFEGINKHPTTSVDFNKNSKKDVIPFSQIARYLLLKRQLKKSTNVVEQNRLKVRLSKMENASERIQIERKTNSIVGYFVGEQPLQSLQSNFHSPPEQIKQIDCHHVAVKTIERECKHLKKSPFVSEFITPIVNLCEQNLSTNKIVQQIKKHCF